MNLDFARLAAWAFVPKFAEKGIEYYEDKGNANAVAALKQIQQTRNVIHAGVAVLALAVLGATLISSSFSFVAYAGAAIIGAAAVKLVYDSVVLNRALKPSVEGSMDL